MRKYLFEDYQVNISNACLISSFSNLFMNCETGISESDIFFLGDGMTFDYSWKKDVECLKDILIFHDSNKMMINFFDIFNETLSIKKLEIMENPARFSHILKEKIDNNQPVILSINTKYITYYKVKAQRYRPHFLTLIGYEDDDAIVADCLVPTVKEYETYVGPFTFENLCKASKIMNYTYYDFNYFQTINKIKNIPKENIHKNFIHNLQLHLDINIPNLKLFANNIKNIKDDYNEADIISSAEDLFFNIKYNGILHSRILICNHLVQYEKAIDLVEKAKNIVKRWEAVNYTLLKNNLTNANPNKYSDLSINILNLLDYEIEVYNGIICNYYCD